MPERWIVISLDALANLALGPYGSSWNSTPSLDQLAAAATTFDRVIVPSDEPSETLQRCWTARIDGESWVQRCRRSGRVELLALRDLAHPERADHLATVATQAGFDACTLVDWQFAAEPADEVESTAFAHLVMTLLERLQPALDEPPSADDGLDWSVLWLHSDFLARHWDAPRWLFPLQELDDGEEPIDPSDPEYWDDDAAGADEESTAVASPPPLQDTTQPPHYQIAADDHPDWVTSWMQTYGCQVRLVDHVVRWVQEFAEQLDPNIGIAIVGTSGMSLGQNGWIGHRAGPVRSPQIQVPLMLHAPGQAPLRCPELTALPAALSYLLPGARPPSPAVWAQQTARLPLGADIMDVAEDTPQVITESARAVRVVTTPQWFLVRDSDEQVSLFLKPDDRDDVNDVASRCQDVIEQLENRPPSD